jgi:hypothetical protein
MKICIVNDDNDDENRVYFKSVLLYNGLEVYVYLTGAAKLQSIYG